MRRTPLHLRLFIVLGLFGMCTLALGAFAFSREGVDRATGTEPLPAVISVAAVLLAAYALALALARPVRELSQVAERLLGGDLEARSELEADESWKSVAGALSHLAGRLGAVTRELEALVAQRTAELDRKADQLRALGQVGQQVAAVLEPDHLLPYVTRLMRGTFAYDLVAMVQARGSDLVVRAVAARGVSHPPVGRVFASGSPEATRLGEVIASGGGVCASVTPVSDRIRARSELVMPIRMRDRVLGALVVQSEKPDAFDEDDAFTVHTIAGQVAVALENARLLDQERRQRDTAIAEERTRIAREIHDTLAQGFMGVLMHLRALRGAQDEETRLLHWTEAEALAREGLEEARRSVWNLRPERLEGQGLAGALADEVERLKRRGGLHVELAIEGDVDRLPPETAACVLRIAQEALHNTLKHAHAHTASVRVRVDDRQTELTVSDDGIGFVPDASGDGESGGSEKGGARAGGKGSGDSGSKGLGPTRRGFGLQGMRERARLMAGEVEIRSAPNAGTTVLARIPHRKE